jgi:putative addiction module component (TIGR02574 family)
MSKRNITAIIKEALEKSDDERAKIAEVLISSLEEQSDLDLEKKWQEEINNRLRQIDLGAEKTIPWDDVYKELYGKASKPN